MVSSVLCENVYQEYKKNRQIWTHTRYVYIYTRSFSNTSCNIITICCSSIFHCLAEPPISQFKTFEQEALMNTLSAQ